MNDLHLSHGRPIQSIDADVTNLSAQVNQVYRLMGRRAHLVHVEMRRRRDSRLARHFRALRYPWSGHLADSGASLRIENASNRTESAEEAVLTAPTPTLSRAGHSTCIGLASAH